MISPLTTQQLWSLLLLPIPISMCASSVGALPARMAWLDECHVSKTCQQINLLQ